MSFSAETSNGQNTEPVPSDGLEYQTIQSFPGEDGTEIVTLDGMMPINAEVNVQSSQEFTGDSLFAYDISITDQNGEEFQPESGDPIKVEITNSAIGDARQADRKLRLWHIDDNGLREEITDFRIRDDRIIFEASGFSVYEVDDGTPALRTYKFMMPGSPHDNTGYAAYYYPINSQRQDGSYKEICSQTIKNGEGLIFPQFPADIDSKYTFVGWFIGNNGIPSDQQLDFNHIPAVTENETVELYAVFESCVYAIFHEQYNGRTQTFPVFATRRGKLVYDEETSELKAEFSFDDLKVIYDDEDKEEGTPPSMQFVGWTTEPIKDYMSGETAEKLPSPYTFSISEDSDDQSIRLYPIFEPIRWLEFDSNGSGATYIPPMSFPKEEGVVFDDSVPVRSGYTFQGWYTAKDGGTQVTDSAQNLISTVNTDKLAVRNGKLFVKEPYIQVKLYAHWVSDDSRYTVIIWKQKESDDRNATQKTYDYAESYTISENIKTEQVVSVANTYKTKNYPGFYYSGCDDAKAVAGNGSTVLNVYYDRCTVVYKFLSDSNNNASTLDTWNGLYGQNITKYNYTWVSTASWRFKKSDQKVVSYLESFNFIDTAYANYNSASHTYTTEIFKAGTNSSYQIIHVLQDMDGTYDLNHTDLVYHTNAPSGNATFIFSNKYEGFTVYGYSLGTFTANPTNNALDYQEQADPQNQKKQSVQINYQNLYVYHKRKTNTLIFVDSTSPDRVYKTEEVLYQSLIEGYKPVNPTSQQEGYDFTNWYFNEACSSNAVIDFSNTTMPNANMIIYAGWETIWFKIEIDPNGGELSSTQATFFWEPYNGDPIVEYTNVSRNYEADVNGTYYYAKHDRAYYRLGDTWQAREDSITDRGAYYTTDMTQATASTRYREATGAYRYLGWYEVDPDTGEETPYYFGEPVMHDTYLRLHWKQLGTYYIKYDAGEGTIALADQMGTEFDYQITMTQTESKTVTRTFYYSSFYSYQKIDNSQYPTTSTPYSDTTTITTITDLKLTNGESDSFVLFFSSPADTVTELEKYTINGVVQTFSWGWSTYDVYYQDATTNQTISQTITITQVQDTDFSTSNDAADGNQRFNSSYISSANADPVTITYTNRQKLKKAVNVAVSSGDVLIEHNDLRTSDTSIYEHDFTTDADWKVADTAVISPDALIGSDSDYIFTAIITGIETDGKITREQANIVSLSFGEITPGVYDYYLNGDTAQLLEDQEIFFVYAKKPTIRYLYEKPDGTFEELTTFTRNHESFTRAEIAQGETLPVPADGLLIDQISTPGMPAFLIPGDLDYQDDILRLDLNRVSVGDSSGITEESDSESMQITLTDGKLQYRFHDADTPRSFTEDAVVYAIYTIKGYELTLTKQVLGDAAGNDTFTFEISSDRLTYSSYDTSTGPVTASGNTMTLTVQRGESVTIFGLLSGEYTIRETTVGDYEMTAKVNGTDAKVTGNRVAASITDNTSVDIMNTYPIPVTAAGEGTVHGVIVVSILMAAAFVFICRRKGEKQNERPSL